MCTLYIFFFFSSRRRHTRCSRDWSSDVCSSDLCAVDPLAGGGGPPETRRGDDAPPDSREEPSGLGRGTDRAPLCAHESGPRQPGCTRMEDGEGEDLSLLARHAIGADPRDRRRATAHPSRQRAARGGAGGIPQGSPCRRGRGGSKSLVSPFKSELRTTSDLMGLADGLKRRAPSQVLTLHSPRQCL